MRIFFVAAALILAARIAAAQTPARPSFEVASVKPAPAPIATKDDYSAGYNAGMRAAMADAGMRITGQRVNITDNTLRDMIRIAYDVRPYQISAPGWMSTEKYEVIANMPAGSDRTQAPAMLQTLLEDRFHLKFHRETRTTAVYALVQVKTGAKLKPTESTGPVRGGGMARAGEGGGRVQMTAGTMAALADLLSRISDRPVLDDTGIFGKFDVNVIYGDDLNGSPGAAPSLTAALNSLGLKLEKRDAGLEMILVDSADKIPVEN